MVGWNEMTGVTGHMNMKYEGLDANRHLLDATQYAKSVDGASRLYRLISHYCLYGEVLASRQHSDIRCFSAPPKEGSFEQTLVILTGLTHQIPAFADVYKKAFDWLTSQVMAYVKKALSGNSDVKELVEVIKEQARQSSDLNHVMANGLIKANDNAHQTTERLTEKLLATLPLLVEAARTPMRNALAPIGKSCDQITQFADSDHPVEITEPEALAIRSNGEVSVGEPGDYVISRIYALSVDTGVCRVEIEGYFGSVHGKITDIALSFPNNAYTKAMGSHASLKVRARPVFKDGELHRLFITET